MQGRKKSLHGFCKTLPRVYQFRTLISRGSEVGGRIVRKGGERRRGMREERRGERGERREEREKRGKREGGTFNNSELETEE